MNILAQKVTVLEINTRIGRESEVDAHQKAVKLRIEIKKMMMRVDDAE